MNCSSRTSRTLRQATCRSPNTGPPAAGDAAGPEKAEVFEAATEAKARKQLIRLLEVVGYCSSKEIYAWQRTTSSPASMLAALMDKKEKLQEELRNIEKQVYDLETSYLQDSNQCGNVLKGFEGFLSSSKSAIKCTINNFLNYFLEILVYLSPQRFNFYL
ncbi:hypothetical protein COCNU_06G006760 [Cocos nucifera]|uniref:Chromatin modification-related protein MEAF6 n=1 Tax=Cocos nucifera TaxID=13894 RepID=A0A8K0IBQ0_COCNU|nr:hypothetical protein COCNU_06G006760 [Cocos nucifera]